MGLCKFCRLVAMDFSQTSHHDLEQHLIKVLKRESNLVADSIEVMLEIHRRKLHLMRGFSSLPEYCIKVFHMTENQAWKRSQAVHAISIFPNLLQDLKKGHIHLSNLALISSKITPENAKELAEAAKSLSKRQLESFIHKKFQKAPETRPLTLYLGEDSWHHWNQICQDHPGISETKVLDILMNAFQLKPTEVPAVTSPGKSTRYIPDTLRQAVFGRDRGRCQFRSPDGQQCYQTKNLEIDHIVPIGMGGKTSIDNLRLLCRAHNQLHADQCFGREFMKLKKLRGKTSQSSS